MMWLLKSKRKGDPTSHIKSDRELSNSTMRHTMLATQHRKGSVNIPRFFGPSVHAFYARHIRSHSASAIPSPLIAG
jgi:hypothetical protein